MARKAYLGSGFSQPPTKVARWPHLALQGTRTAAFMGAQRAQLLKAWVCGCGLHSNGMFKATLVTGSHGPKIGNALASYCAWSRTCCSTRWLPHAVLRNERAKAGHLCCSLQPGVCWVKMTDAKTRAEIRNEKCKKRAKSAPKWDCCALRTAVHKRFTRSTRWGGGVTQGHYNSEQSGKDTVWSKTKPRHTGFSAATRSV